MWWDGREPRFLVELCTVVSILWSRSFRCAACVPVDLAETANTDGLAHVDVAGNGGSADVEPVDVLGRQLLGVCVLLATLPKAGRDKRTYAMS